MDVMDGPRVDPEANGLPVVTSAGELRESRRVAAEETMAAPQAVLTSKGSFGSRKQPKLKPILERAASSDHGGAEDFAQGTVLTVEQMFQVLDVDTSGGLDLIELKRFVKLLGVPMTEAQIHGMLESKLKNQLMAGAKPELDFERFKELVDPILEEAQEAEARAEEERTHSDKAANGVHRGVFEAIALGWLTLDHPVRLAAIKLISWPLFDFAVLVLIGVNSVLMALEDPLRPEQDNPEWMARAELVFTILFTIEMSVKIVALGLFRGPHTYLQSPWNILDAVVVVTSWLPIIFSSSSSRGGAIRAFRLLRPLRTINRFPGLKRLVTTILMSIPQMQVLVIMVVIYVFTFAVVGVQLWQGAMLQRCHQSADSRTTETCVAGEEEICDTGKTLVAHDHAGFCDRAAVGADGWTSLVEGKRCAGEHDVCELHDINPYDGVLSFDTFGSACIPVMQMATVSSWQEVMHITQDVTGNAAAVYFMFGTVFGGYFLFNLFVAVLKSKFEISMAVAAEGAEVFDLVDEDGSGELDIGELDMILKNKGVFMTEGKLQELFRKIDADGGGTIDLAEFTTWLRGDDILAAQLRERMDVGKSRQVAHQAQAVNAELPKADQIRQKLRLFQPDNDWGNLFEYYDLDGDCKMGRDEFVLLLRRDIGLRKHQITDDEIERVFTDIDTAQSGDIDAQEFGAWVVLETAESHWVKLRAALRVQGSKGLSQLIVASINDDSTVSPASSQPSDNFDDEITVRLQRGAGIAAPMWKESLRATLRSEVFRYAVVGMIAANTLVLAVDHHGITRERVDLLQTTNAWLTLLFACEMLAKMVGFTWDEFFGMAGARPDIVMVTTGLVDVATVYFVKWVVSDDSNESTTPADVNVSNVFIVIRVLRPLRLIYTLPKLEPVYRVCVKTVAGLVYIASLAGLFMFIFSVLGMQLFGGKFNDFEPKPRAHYDSFTIAFTTSFQVITFDSWQIVMYDAIRATGAWSAAYFVAWVVIGAVVMLNLLLVIILDVYVISSHATLDSERDQSAEDDDFDNPLIKSPTIDRSQSTTFEYDVSEEDDEPVYDINEGNFGTSRSCGVFSSGNRFRKLCVKIAESQNTDRFILLLIVANCITMAMDHPDVDPLSKLGAFLLTCDVAFTIIFTVEMCVQIVAVGFYREDDAYLRGWWNRLDFTIVVVSWVDYLASALEIKFLRTLRLLRALRALRMFNRMTGLKVLIDSLLESIKALSATFAVTIIIFVAYAILGVTAFKGRLHRCTDDVGVSGIDTCIGTYVEGGVLQSNLWVRPHNNFDNVANGMFTLFTVSTSNDWIITAHLAVDAPDFAGQQPIRENQPWRILYFMMFIVLVNFFFLNLFIGVIYGKYVDFASVGMTDLSKDQRNWLDILGQLAFAKPQKDVRLMVREQAGIGGGLQAKAFDLVSADKFDHAIAACIIANCIMMATTYYQEPQGWTDVQAVLNIAFTLIFTAEMVLKMFAFGFAVYFGDSWCRFDCFVVCGSWADLAFTWLGVELFSSSLFRIVRVSRVIGRIGRIFKLLGDSKSTLGLDEVMKCLYQALPQLAYIGILVSLILFIFAVLAMNLMGQLEHTGCIGLNTNFERAPIAALTLLGVATKDRITCTIHGAMVEPPYCDEDAGTCGTPGLPQVFFITFSLVIMFTTLEMFVNVVIGSFEDLSRAAGLPITLAHIDEFQTSWQKFDPTATGWIALSDVKAMFDGLPPQLGMDNLAGEHDFDARLLRLIELPNGTPTRHLLGETPQEVMESETDAGIKTRIERIVQHVFDAADREMNLRRSLRKSQDAGTIRLSVDKLHERLQSISGLTRAEVSAIVRLLDGGTNVNGQQVASERGNGQIDREEFASGLEKLDEARMAGAVPDGRAHEAMLKLICGQVNFHEMLYAVCERKAGKPLPNTNDACRAARLKVGVLMPSIKNAVLDDVYRNAGAPRTTPAIHAALTRSKSAM